MSRQKTPSFDIAPGAVVELRSGGQAMTVVELNGDDVACVWSDKGQVRRDSFPSIVLKLSPNSNLTININLGDEGGDN